MSLYLVLWYWPEEGRAPKYRSFEHVWAKDSIEAQEWANKLTPEGMTNRVHWVYAASTTKDLPTPPGLETFEIKQGAQL